MARVRQKAADIRECQATLGEYARWEDKAFLENKVATDLARYNIIMLVEAAANVASHLCVKLLGRAPDNYAESFLALADAGFMSGRLALRLKALARLRAKYLEIEPALERSLRDLLSGVEV